MKEKGILALIMKEKNNIFLSVSTSNFALPRLNKITLTLNIH